MTKPDSAAPQAVSRAALLAFLNNIDEGAGHYHPRDRAAFLEACAKIERYLAACQKGEHLTLFRQLVRKVDLKTSSESYRYTDLDWDSDVDAGEAALQALLKVARALPDEDKMAAFDMLMGQDAIDDLGDDLPDVMSALVTTMSWNQKKEVLPRLLGAQHKQSLSGTLLYHEPLITLVETLAPEHHMAAVEIAKNAQGIPQACDILCFIDDLAPCHYAAALAIFKARENERSQRRQWMCQAVIAFLPKLGGQSRADAIAFLTKMADHEQPGWWWSADPAKAALAELEQAAPAPQPAAHRRRRRRHQHRKGQE